MINLYADLGHKIGERFGSAVVATDGAETLVEESIDITVVATPETAHLETTEAALSAGSHVPLEKPTAKKRRTPGELVNWRTAPQLS